MHGQQNIKTDVNVSLSVSIKQLYIWIKKQNYIQYIFHIRTVQHLDIIKVLFIHQLMHQ